MYGLRDLRERDDDNITDAGATIGVDTAAEVSAADSLPDGLIHQDAVIQSLHVTFKYVLCFLAIEEPDEDAETEFAAKLLSFCHTLQLAENTAEYKRRSVAIIWRMEEVLEELLSFKLVTEELRFAINEFILHVQPDMYGRTREGQEGWQFVECPDAMLNCLADDLDVRDGEPLFPLKYWNTYADSTVSRNLKRLREECVFAAALRL